MIKIDMDNGKRYSFGNSDYDNYYVSDNYLVIEKGSQWVGCFSVSHMVGFFVEVE